MSIWPFQHRKNDELAGIVHAFESETAAVIARTAPRSEHTILITLVGIIGVSIALMSFGQLERVVTGTGRVVPTRGQIYLSPLGQAIIKEIRVHTGDIVKKGQVLATLDPTVATGDLTQMQQKVDSDEATIARLRDELDDQTYAPTNGSPYELLQLNLWRQRQADYASSIADFDARIANQEAIVNSLTHDISDYQKRFEVVSKLEEMQTNLEKEGAGSRANMLAASDNRLEIGRLLASDQGQVVAARQLTTSLRAQKAAFVQKWKSDASDQLVQTSNDLDAARNALKKASLQKDLVTLTAPEDAVVLKIGNASTGSVESGNNDSGNQPLFILVPTDGPLEATVDIPANDIGFISAGDAVTIKLDAYRYLHYGTAKGVLETVSKGSFRVDQDTNQPMPPYYTARIRLTDVHLRDVPPNFAVTPGMTLSADILVGHRSIISYLVEGGLRISNEGMREP